MMIEGCNLSIESGFLEVSHKKRRYRERADCGDKTLDILSSSFQSGQE